MDEEGVGGTCVLSFMTLSVHSGDKKEKEEGGIDRNSGKQ